MRLKFGLPLLRAASLAGFWLLAANAADAQQPLPLPRPAVAKQPSGIQGPVWRLTALRGLDAGLLPSGPQSVTAQFEHGRVSGFSGCNRYFGPYSIKDGQLVVGNLAGSMMACSGPAMQIENALHRAFSGSFKPLLEGDRLTLVAADGQPALSFQAAPKATLEGLSTTVSGFNNGRQAVVSPKSDTTIKISFENGIVRGYAGCNYLPRQLHHPRREHRDRPALHHAQGLQRSGRDAAGAGVPRGAEVDHALEFQRRAARHAPPGRRTHADGNARGRIDGEQVRAAALPLHRVKTHP